MPRHAADCRPVLLARVKIGAMCAEHGTQWKRVCSDLMSQSEVLTAQSRELPVFRHACDLTRRFGIR